MAFRSKLKIANDDASIRGLGKDSREFSVTERIHDFEKYAHAKYKELKANQGGSHIPDPSDINEYGGVGNVPYGPELPAGEVIIMPAELQKNLDDARDAYIKISSKRRMISIGQKGKVEKAKLAYDNARDAAGSHIAAQYEAAGVSPAEIKARSNAGGALELMDLANMTNNHQNEIADGKSLRRFNEFWARNGGRNQETGKRNWAGMAKKAAAMAIITAIPGAGIAFVAGTLIGAGTGALVGSALASSISRNLFRSHVEKGANAKTVAAEQAAYLIANNADNLDKSEANLDSASVSDIYQAQTDKINTRNKVRHVGAVAMGALSAVGGYYGTRAVIGAGRNLLGGGVKGHLTGPLKPATPSQIPGPTGPRIPTVPTNPTGSRIPTIPTGEIVPPVPAPTGNTLDIPKDLIDTSKWKLPWNWGQEKFGSQAANKLYSLSDQAKLDGHAVEWIRKGTNTARLFIDGKDNTAYVVNVLNHYNG